MYWFSNRNVLGACGYFLLLLIISLISINIIITNINVVLSIDTAPFLPQTEGEVGSITAFRFVPHRHRIYFTIFRHLVSTT